MPGLLDLKTEAFGIDISDFSVKIAKLKIRGREFDLACFGEEPIPPGLVDNGDIKDEVALAKIINQSLAKAKGEKIRTKEVIFSLPDERAFLRIIQLPKMTPEELRKAVPFEAENHIPIPIKESYLDFEAVEPLVDHLDHCDVLLGAVPQKLVDSYIRTLKMAGLNPFAVDIESLSISRALVKNWISTRSILLIDFGATRTVLIIFSGRTIRFVNSVSFSSEELTKAIALELKISRDEAKRIQMNYGLEAKTKVQLQEKTGDFELEREILDDHRVLKALAPFLEQLTAEIKKFLDFCYSHASHEHLPLARQEVTQVLLSGGGANLKGLDKYLARELGVSVTFGNPWVNILPEPQSRVPEEYLRRSLAYANVLGLALRGMITDQD
ncbi:MAG: type IV pilus assembly protein PilM [bacterium]|nr:type IV pilus assembly protein PilM [bacterium]